MNSKKKQAGLPCPDGRIWHRTGMWNGTIMALSGCAVLLLAGCDTKDPIFNTPHPDHGMVTLTTEWSGIGQGLTPPSSYTVKAAPAGSGAAAAGYTATLTGITNKLDHLFEPGNYRFCVYNAPEWITLSGTVARVEAEAVTPTDAGGSAFGASDANDSGPTVHGDPGWLFSCALDASIKADTEMALTAPMQQQVRQLTLVVEPTGGTADRIERITGVLSGIAGTFDLGSGMHGTPSSVVLAFSKITSGADAGKWSATVRLLGVAGTQQRLTGSIAFAGGLDLVPLDSDLTKPLAAFNADKRAPLALEGSVVETPSAGGSTATIDHWTTVTREPVTAE